MGIKILAHFTGLQFLLKY